MKTTLPVSIPLSLLTQDTINKIQRRSNSLPDIIQSCTMAPPTNNGVNRLRDAHLLVAFSNVARDQGPVRTEQPADEHRFSRNIATTPDDLPRRPDAPSSARVIEPPACDNYTQTDANDDYDLIEIIKAYKITRRQILRLICNTDINNNKNKNLTEAHIIEIVDDKEPNEALLEELRAHSDHQKKLILKNYNAVRPGARHDVYDFITKCLVVSNLVPDRNVQNAIERNMPAIEAPNEDEGEPNPRETMPLDDVPVIQMTNHHIRCLSPVTPAPQQPEPPTPEEPRVQQPSAPEQLRLLQHPQGPEPLRAPAPPQPPTQAASPEVFSTNKAKTAHYYMMRAYQLMNPSMQPRFAAPMNMRNIPRAPAPREYQPHQHGPGPSPAPAPMPGPPSSYVQHHQANYGQPSRFHNIPPGYPGTVCFDNPKQKPATITSGAYELLRQQQHQQSATQGNYPRLPAPSVLPAPSARQQQVFNNTGNMPSTSNFVVMNQSISTSQEMYQAPVHTPNRYTWVQQVPMGQQTGEASAYTSRRGRRPKTTSTREANLPVPPINKYKYMMGQQKQLEVERQQQLAFHTQLRNYPNTAWNHMQNK